MKNSNEDQILHEDRTGPIWISKNIKFAPWKWSIKIRVEIGCHPYSCLVALIVKKAQSKDITAQNPKIGSNRIEQWFWDLEPFSAKHSTVSVRKLIAVRWDHVQLKQSVMIYGTRPHEIYNINILKQT